MMRFLIPLGIFFVLVIFLGIGLKLNPREVPSPLIGKPAPHFQLAQLHTPEQTFSPEQMKGKVWLLNVWASWCVSCRAEHPVLNEFARSGQVEIIGLNYKDEPADARQWLAQLGNPYTISVMDTEGMAGLDWGVYGVPETFVIDKKGLVRFKLTGPVDPNNLQTEIMPLLQTLNGEAG
ncbi:MAG: DsbE family thiol:disulfide interchange protein [Methylicorpusculum sp.]|nr:DsbE family thiol:disulfide interchange protein [Methylicorpusculum sp.]MDO8939715.1 DsbE family thiol:disulfide interchange protein [Methylicorpusculum sp.]MDP2176968.1 DsbE family thiol:disulfide interchange protein [Methylicorpusculum sp.]MDP2204601.1 DsbE family thiol:disulfide interchange protein [Methylicorpusculum sp.]MDP3528738.1 DsbE family thiol:disulfide interchange protein [Methylicorpusculum sp.]MDZ4152377.1 DsbE family thiol:disulfide interchange protein [Methylicorpusculum sp